ncbi:hypothetical protein CFR73_13310 [Novacetimonas maltaceti]|uniref:hypothetical protein n=1 Tax=Novacetimonas maltaceti TaxID=1203393 RepID=UPI000D72504B|nr:hypothetical protein [Novacetimonas maltaceti]PYD59122.1 hypothetical protein CFR73_13310 [Novacetimonas maltaceti]
MDIKRNVLLVAAGVACVSALLLMGGYLVWSDHKDVDFAKHNILMKHSQEEADYAQQLDEANQTVVRDQSVFLDVHLADFDTMASKEDKAWLLKEVRKFDISRVHVFDGHKTTPYSEIPCKVELCFVPIFAEQTYTDMEKHLEFVQVDALDGISRTLVMDAEQFWRLRKMVIRNDRILFAHMQPQMAAYEKEVEIRKMKDEMGIK